MTNDASRGPSGTRPTVTTPRWRQGFDAVEHELTPRVDAVVRSDEFAVALGLVTHALRAVQREAARSTRWALHLLNLPAGSDVTRILGEIGQLRQQVRELSRQLEARDGDESKEGTDGAARPGRRPRAASS